MKFFVLVLTVSLERRTCDSPSLWSGCCRDEAEELLFLLVETKGAGPASLSLKLKKESISLQKDAVHTQGIHKH